jgi:hypothetical protein
MMRDRPGDPALAEAQAVAPATGACSFGGQGNPGSGSGVPAGPTPHPAGVRPALQPAPLRRRPDDQHVAGK